VESGQNHSKQAICVTLLLVKPISAFLLLLAGVVAQAQEALPANAQTVSFPAAGGALNGFLYVPAGQGPFPAILWNHGSERRPGAQQELAEFYNSHGFVFFLPHRRGQGRSPGPYIMDEINSQSGPFAATQAQQEANEDVVAALKWLRAQSQVDPNRIVVSGCSFGGIQTLLTAEKGLGARAFIAFAPAARSWENPVLEQVLSDAVREARGPVFILQARNDFSIQPVQVLGKIAKAKGGQATIYPPFGKTHEDGHWKFATTEAGIAIWGEDVLHIINDSFR
jgi:dienelactone hydrolase